MNAPAGLRRALRIAGFAGLTAAMTAAYSVRDELTRSSPGRDARRDRWTRRWSSALLAMFAVDVALIGEVFAPPVAPRGRLIVANHRSAIDIVVMLHTFGGFIVSRGDLSGWPLIGTAASRAGTLFVDRADKHSGASAIRRIRDQLARGQTVCIFPEGTTFAGDEVRPFHRGAFLAAARLEVDIVPVGLAYAAGSDAAFVDESFGRHLARVAGSPGAQLTVSVGRPLRAESSARTSVIAEEARMRVDAEVKRARLHEQGRVGKLRAS